jgi:hypothetical protein
MPKIIDENAVLHQQNAMNVILKDTPPGLMTVDMEELSRRNAERRATADAANPPKGPEDGWRDELNELERRLKGAFTEEQAKQHAGAEGRKCKEAVDKVENAIKESRELLKTPYLSLHTGWDGTIRQTFSHSGGSGQLCGCDGCVILRKIEHFESELPELKRQQQKSIRLCGAMIQGAKELDALRPRYRELAKRAFQIDKATQRNPDIGDGRFRDEGTPSRGNPAGHRTPAGLTYEK